jgi:hypothetical protein
VKGPANPKNPSGLVPQDIGKLGAITDTAGFYNARQFQFALKLLF